ncbi:DNA-binding transcriptional regulator, AcrR family [Microlunatus sagamiharensis]|uniref:DNA-binding transcriptional regulator, AcrR family n=1 Tax=Microlunatus sagamiharensis TaxID=546874 RepID=A0A1H2MEU3_9ACTN|nr:TetR/AcrR family transcriptional regulator [Microlunatus sagamiharensis]SDU91777.1 DNA-binding transcriptional regulator, AcrR family [Microlunatus sagamiharensis]
MPSSETSAGTSAGRPGGRSSRVLASIYESVGALVGEGAERITFPVIAERAGVTPTTLYRRWDDVDALLEEVAVAALTREGESAPDTGSVEGDLTAWALAIARDISRPERVRYLRAMVAARGGPGASCPVTDRRQDQAREVVRHAVERGEKTPSVDQVLDHVIAPLYHHVVFGLGVDDAYARRLVADVLAMVR